jgi:hypothetical protein
MIMNKDILAKLLATENITVVHENAPTASFNVRDRVLTLPLWDNLDADNYDHFIGHEVGHALYTPEDGWHDAVCDRGRAYKSFLNVIEDARIERLIQNKYPGLRRNFIKSYRKLFADGFFGANLDEINNFDLIDRINTYFKLGQTCGVRIEKDEMPWIKEIEECATWEQVVDIADRLFAQEKAKRDEEKEILEDLMKNMDEEFGEEEGETEQMVQQGLSDADWDDPEEGEEQNEQGDATEEDTEEGDEEQGEGTDTDGEGEEEKGDAEELKEGEGDIDDDPIYSDEPIARTEEALHNNIRKEFNDSTDCRVYNLRLNTNKVDDLILDYKTVYTFGDAPQGYGEMKPHLAMYGEKLWKDFQTNNKKTVNYMVKEFEMRKKASEYARTSLAKTGVIDPVKMNNYKFSDDIFRKMAVTPEGKNHGMILYLDWSGSMHKHVKPTIEQLLNLVMFCRQVNIPYRVYAFTDRFDYGAVQGSTDKVNDVEVNTLQYKVGFRLMEFFNNRMNRGEFTRMAQMLLAIAETYHADYTNYCLPWQFNLGGTPLDDAIMAGIQIHNEFKKTNRLDIVNTVFLTDGDSHPIEAKVRSSYAKDKDNNNVALWNLGIRYNVIKYIDPITKKQYRVQGYNGHTKALLELFRDHTESNAIGYRIVNMNKRHLSGDLRKAGLGFDQIDKLHADLKKDKFITIPNCGYDKFFAIAGGKNLKTANSTIDVADDASVAKIRTAFKKANSNRKGTRVLLTQFIEMVA